MLRANLLNTFNSKVKEKSLLDGWFNEFGGNIFTNCYTPSPDSPRSLACIYTGLYPKNNGCCKRLHWPKFFLKSDLVTIFDLFEKKSFPMFIRVNRNEDKLGFLPSKDYQDFNLFYDLDNILNEINKSIGKSTNLFSFISLTDFHWAIDDYGNNLVGNYYGQKHLLNCFRKIFNELNPDMFDYVFIFSDHGFKLKKEIKREKKICLLNDDRSKVVLLIRKKGEKKIRKHNDLTSIMDILPTLEKIINGKSLIKCDGVSLFNQNKDRYIVIEDHSIFAPHINLIHDLWAIRTDTHFYMRDFFEELLLTVVSENEYREEKKTNNSLIEKLNFKIGKISCSYLENLKLHYILKTYKNMYVYRDQYSDGEKRKKSIRRTILSKLRGKVLKKREWGL